MHPSRLTTLLFFYAGALLLVQFAVVQGFRLAPDAVGTLGMGLVFCAVALNRYRLPPDETGPTAYGPLVYVLAGLCLVLTLVTAGLVVPTLS
jgi:hypothetical protein